MHSKQDKTDNASLATKPTEPTQKATHNAAASTRTPAWTNAWGDHPPIGLVSPVAHLQAKGVVSQPGDSSEQEAEQVSDNVMRMAVSGSSILAAPPEHPGTLPGLATSASYEQPMIQRAPLEEGTASTSTTPESTSTSDAAATESAPTSATSTTESTPASA